LNTETWIDALSIAYRLSGNAAFLERAKVHWDRASKAVYGNPFTRTAGDNEVGRFVNKNRSGIYYDQGGDLTYVNLFFYDYVHQTGTAVHNPEKPLPSKYKLNRVFPNPFNSLTTIQYSLPMKSKVNLMIYNIQGSLVTTLVSEDQQAGFYEVKWGEGMPSGVYFCRLDVQSLDDKRTLYTDTQKMLLLK
jgi:hypothetical protein